MSVLPLECDIQHYAWGQSATISNLIGAEPDGRPEAELWMGAHPKAPSRLADGRTLLEAIGADPVGMLGRASNDRFGQLPFLFKVLAAEVPLSIQAHPSLEHAAAGFANENDAGIALDSPVRTYRDPNHKPEMICALTPFEAKCGFRPVAATRRLFDALGRQELDPVRALLASAADEAECLRSVLEFLLGSAPQAARTMAQATAQSAAQLGDGRHSILAEFGPDLAACARVAEAFPADIGGVVALLLNHVVLAPGEALFLGSGNLHAYLHGVGVELMANSDNVVRGGLTPKHIDVDELLAVVDCQPIDVPIQTPAGPVHTYDSPVPEFALTRYCGAESVHPITGPAIVLATEGAMVLDGEPAPVGRAYFVPASELAMLSGDGLAWVAGVGSSLGAG